MSLRRLTMFVMLIELIGVGVFFLFIVGATAATGGRATFDMTQFGERWIEYAIILVMVAVTPYTLYYFDQQ